MQFYVKWYVLLLYLAYIPFLRLVTLAFQILRREEWRWCILLQMYGSLNTKILNETADWCLVTETLHIRTVGLK